MFRIEKILELSKNSNQNKNQNFLKCLKQNKNLDWSKKMEQDLIQLQT